jgi:hypothetical protein
MRTALEGRHAATKRCELDGLHLVVVAAFCNNIKPHPPPPQRFCALPTLARPERALYRVT